MYINKIDDTVDKILDDFYNKVIIKKDVSKYFEEVNFVKYQLEINKIFVDYIKSINIDEINDIVKDEDDTRTIIELIKKYLAFYMFMTFAFFYTQKIETYINNVVEFSKNQPGFNYKVDNFFNSESNSLVVEFYSQIKNILILLDVDAAKMNQLIKKKEYAPAINFLNDMGTDIVESRFKLKSLKGNVKEQAHNIIKTIIIIDLYLKTDKVIVQQVLDKSEKEIGEFIYIDIVIPSYDFIDYNTIEMSLSKIDVENGLASEIYDLISQEEILDKIKTHDDKILDLLNSKLVIPISEDFLLYHKESEKYENTAGMSNVSAHTKKKDETKIKYIVNKIDNVSEYFSKSTKENQENKKNIEKLFYGPLSDRRTVLVNNFEDTRIVYKFQTQGKRAIENNEYYNDLLNYMHYPYINFKEFQNYGFNIMVDNTIDVIRSVNFEKVNVNNKNKEIQFRVNSGNSINIVGFVIPSTYSDTKCLKLKDFVDIRKIGYKENNKIEKISNGFDGSLKMIGKNISSNSSIENRNKKRPSCIWLFDLEKDKVKFDTYEISTKIVDGEYIKIMMSSMYDNIMAIISNEITKLINKKKEITLQEFYKVVKKIDKHIIEFPRDGNLYNELEKFVYYEKCIKTKDVYDTKEDEFPGLIGEVIKLPSVPKEVKSKIPTIKLEKFRKVDAIKSADESEIEQYNAICQHNITWDNITALRKKNPNKSNEMLFEFFQQYVVTNHEDDFICKSCGVLINLRNYVLDGSYDDDGRFVSFNMPMDVPLEDIPEYEKYRASIRNIEKDIDRIASIANIRSLSGTSTAIRMRVRHIVKDTIDLLLIHNTNLKTIYKERTEKISVYGLNKDLTNLFIFELENSIFVYSSKDKDFYKPIKRNNITIYSLFLMILELSDTQIFYMIGDKVCNYYLFAKYGIHWFNGINIRKNNQNTIAPILNYRVLCYIIFYVSCLITKYNLWKYEEGTEGKEGKEGKDGDIGSAKKQKFNPVIQKIIIHTLIDFINSILEVYAKKKHHYIYDMIATKFFQRLNTTYKNEEILDKIKIIEDKRTAVDTKIKTVTNKSKPIKLLNYYDPMDLTDISDWMKIKISKNFISKRANILTQYYNISNSTNCEKGTFHKWELKGKELVCVICGISNLKTSESEELSKAIIDNYNVIRLQKQAKKYCASGELHNYIINTEKQCNICVKCDKLDIDQLGKKELDELNKNIIQMKIDKNELNKQNFQNNKQVKTKKNKQTDFINEIKSNYGKSKQHKEDYYKFIEIFISKIESILGKDINLHNQNIYLRYDSYTVNHDHNGYIIDKPYTIKDDGKTLLHKKNHQFFGKDVLYYTNYKLQIDIFYDAGTKLLLGYKEKSKEFQVSKRQNIYIRVNSSIMNKLKLLGFPSKFINIKDKMEEYTELYKDATIALKSVISDINKERIQSLKKCITNLQRYVFRMAYDFEVKLIDEENNPDKFLDVYKNKLTNIKLKDDKQGKFLQGWKIIKNELFSENILNKTLNISLDTFLLSSEDASMYDYNGNVILFYIVNEMGKLIDINNDKFIRETMGYFLLDIIVRLHNETNEDTNLTNTEIKRFKYTLQIYDEREIDEMTGTTEGFYEEYKEPDAEISDETKELREDELAENEGFDTEEPDDYDNVDYVAGINFNM